MRVAGIDFGTTTVSAVVMDTETGELCFRKTVEHNAQMSGDEPENRVQDTEMLWTLTQNLLYEIEEAVGIPAAIGLTGQMHGMLYVDESGHAVSPLYTWQDGCGGKQYKDGETYASFIDKKVGVGCSGFGLTTHYYLQTNGQIPGNAVSMVTIPDYIGMKLCGRKKAFIADDMAASWGCFDLEKRCFKVEEMKAAGVDVSLIPELLAEHEIVGKTNQGIPVVAALGDNQASVIGSAADLENTLLVNIGTGSQVSMASSEYVPMSGSIELRPCEGASYICVGSTLCGGRAYAMLESFIREITGTEKSAYEMMERLAGEFLEEYSLDEAWKIQTTFSGTRNDPDERGSIAEIGTENFKPGAMIVGMMVGMLHELYDMYLVMKEKTGHDPGVLVGSGNALRRNPVLRRIAEDMFGAKIKLPAYQEEAACGAAMHAMYRAGLTKTLSEAQKIIKYDSSES